jgi:release factor glutamine methyltransferase
LIIKAAYKDIYGTHRKTMDYRNLYNKGRENLEKSQVAEAELDARLLLEYVCGTDRNYLLVHGENEVSPECEADYMKCIEKRSRHIPLQHITGVQNFMGLDFKVNENVLVPRQDTEILVEEVMMELHDGMSILDMCTGSGCILISLLKYSNNCQGTGADLSEVALKTARENALSILGESGADSIDFIKSNIFENISGKYDVIVSNPPYIRSDVIPTLMPEVRDYDPHMALDGGEDGLYFYRIIVEESREHLCGEGKLYFEIGADQADAVKQLMKNAGFVEINVVKDYAGLDRVLYGTYVN